MRRLDTFLRIASVAAFALLVAGCTATPNDKAAKYSPSQDGQHPYTWMQDHWAEYLKNPGQCATCHGSTTVRPTTTPVAPSCFNCHTSGVHHPAGFSAGNVHGRMGAMAAADSTRFSMKGFASCTPCHGDQYNNPVGVTPSCFSCHTSQSPHPARPWGAGLHLPNTAVNHNLVDQSNAGECAKCHSGGAHSTITPVTPAPAGTAPGCFNGTLCHSRTL